MSKQVLISVGIAQRSAIKYLLSEWQNGWTNTKLCEKLSFTASYL